MDAVGTSVSTRPGPCSLSVWKARPVRVAQLGYLLLSGEAPRDVAGQLAEEHLPELAQGPEGVKTAARAAARARHNQVGLFRHGRQGEGFQQHRLAAARISANEDNPCLTAQRCFEVAA